LIELVATIMGSAPGLAAHLARRPILLDSVLSPDFYKSLPAPAEMTRELSAALAKVDDEQDILDTARRWTNDRRFQVGVQQLKRIVRRRGRPAPIPTSRRPRSPPSAIASRRSSPRTTVAFAASGWRCWGWASSAAARCRRRPIST
jgi:Glutamine synthetase adenylyltransferase